MVNPEPTADGATRQHDIQMKPVHENTWSQTMRNKWHCHIGQQDVDTFFVTVTTIHPGSHNWIRSYMLKWLGNYLFLSAMSSLANPHIAMEPCTNYNVHYEADKLPEIQQGQRKSLKLVAASGRRLRAMVQLVQNNRVSPQNNSNCLKYN